MNTTRLLEAAGARPLQACLLIFLVLIAYKATQALYRVYLHPLSRFPGPREAALSTSWLSKLSRTGLQESETERLHERFGTFGQFEHCIEAC